MGKLDASEEGKGVGEEVEEMRNEGCEGEWVVVRLGEWPRRGHGGVETRVKRGTKVQSVTLSAKERSRDC